MRYRKLLCAAFLCLSGILSSTSSLADTVLPVDPTKSWKVIETEHFEVIYDKDNRKLAESFANEAERAHQLLQPILQRTTQQKIPLVVADITDSSNGEATALPRSQIEIYPVLPSVFDPTSEYFSWTREVVTHEYTHILNFEPTSGFMSILKFLFGNIIRPGGYLPRWYTEGLAVEMESRLTPVGRGRSHYYTALVRSQVEDHLWSSDTIDRVNATGIPTWPRGQRPYTYGYFLMHQLSEFPRKDNSTDNVYHLLDERYGGRFPWFINGPVEDLFGMDYQGLLDNTYAVLEKKAQGQLTRLNDDGAKNGQAITQTGYFNFGPQISPDGLKLAAIVSDYNDYPSVRIWTRKSTKDSFTTVKEIPAPLISNKDIHQLSWRADSKHIVYDHSDVYRHYNTINDLYELDISNGDEKRLTEGLRAREATVMSDGSLVFVAATSSNTQLMHADADGKNVTLVYAPADGERVSSPRPFQDGVIYSHRDSKGHEWIESISLKTKKVVARTHSKRTGEIHMMPMADPESPNGFYYAATYSGVMNIYHSDPKHTYAVTNVTTYASSPVFDPSTKELVYSRLTGHGFEIESEPVHHRSTPETVGDMQNYPSAEESPPPKAKYVDEHTYHGVSYLWPQYWIPFIYFVPGGALFDGSTSGADPLNHHQYAIDIAYDTRALQPREELLYSNDSTPVGLDFLFANDYEFLVGANLVEHLTYGYFDARIFLSRDNNKWTFGPEFTYRMTDYAPFLFTEIGPGAYLTYNNVATVKDFQISPENGERFSVGYDYFLSQWGGNTSYPNVHGSASYYLSGRPLPEHHVINLKATAWVSPQQQTILTGTQQAGGEYFGSLLPTPYLVRGYPVGEFIGSTMYIGNFEYRFPISYPYSGWGTKPAFINKWHGALVADAITLDGGYYDSTLDPSPRRAAKLGTFFMGSGLEIRADMTLFYGIPLTMRLGSYYGFTQEAWGGYTYFLGFGSVL